MLFDRRFTLFRGKCRHFVRFATCILDIFRIQYVVTKRGREYDRQSKYPIFQGCSR